MERKESFDALKAMRGMGLKRTMMVVILLLTMILSTALDYIYADFDPSIYQSTAYWIKLLTSNAAVIVILFATRALAKETEEIKNDELQGVKRDITESHRMIADHNMISDFEGYVNTENRRRKLAAYTGRLQRRVFRCKNGKRRAVLIDRLGHAEERIDYLRVKYNRVRISTLFATSDLRPLDDADFEIREGADISRILLMKILSILAIGVLGASIIPDVIDGVNYTMIIGTVIKLFQMAYGGFVGVMDGQSFARGTLLAKFKAHRGFIFGYMERKRKDGTNFEEKRVEQVIEPPAEPKEKPSALERLKQITK